MKYLFVLISTGIILSSCHKEEIAIPGHESGDALENQIELGQDYKNQAFYDLGTNEVVSSNLKTEWDIAFESSSLGWHIILNTSKGMAIHKSDLNFGSLTDPSGLEWEWDVSSGNLDSTAIGDWQSENKLYVIDLGYDHLGNHQGYAKMELTSVDDLTYQIEYGDIADIGSQSLTISKNTDNLFTHFSFLTGEITIAPANGDWDIEFTQYTHLFTDPVQPYLVTGVLLNRYNTSAAEVTSIAFADVTYDDVISLNYSTELDFIGYDWKYFDFQSSLYIVDPVRVFILQTNEGVFYKLHFTDFYDEFGEKGYPKFELQEL